MKHRHDFSLLKAPALEAVGLTLNVLAVWGYISGSFVYRGNIWWVALCTLLFAYLIRSIVDLYLAAIVCFLSRVTLLPARDWRDGIPPEHKAAFVYCVRAARESTVRTAIESLKTSLEGNRDQYLYAVYLSGTEDPELIAKEVALVRTLQSTYGNQRVIYIHRSSNWGTKWGGYQDLMVWLCFGSMYPLNYLHPRYGLQRRDPRHTMFSLDCLRDTRYADSFTEQELSAGIVGDTSGIRQEGGQPLEYVLISDADVVWPPQSALRVVATMADDANRSFSIFQPAVRIANSRDSLYAKILEWGRQFTEYGGLAVWKTYDAFLFYGKGGIRVRDYVDVMLRPGQEVLPPTALSHDFIEARYLRTAYLPHVYVLENAPVDYFEDVRRLQRWLLGDLIGLWHEAFKPLLATLRLWGVRKHRAQCLEKPQPCQNAHFIIRLVARFELSTPAFCVFLLLRIVGGSVQGIYVIGNPAAEIALLCFALFGVTLLPRFIGSFAALVHTRRCSLRSLSFLFVALPELILSTALLPQQLFDRTFGLVKALFSIWRVRRSRGVFEWRPSHEERLALREMTYWNAYGQRVAVVGIGLGILLVLLLTQPMTSVWLASPIWVSFLLGPALSKLTSAPNARGRQR